MQPVNKYLLVAGLLSAAACLLHVAIMFGGPNWYRFFGAGEGMAQLAERGSSLPVIITTGIAILLAIWALYAFSGAGLIPRLPLYRTCLVVISAVYLLRGLLGIPIVLLGNGEYVQELRHRMIFMAVSSFICLVMGVCYAFGTMQIWTKEFT